MVNNILTIYISLNTQVLSSYPRGLDNQLLGASGCLVDHLCAAVLLESMRIALGDPSVKKNMAME